MLELCVATCGKAAGARAKMREDDEEPQNEPEVSLLKCVLLPSRCGDLGVDPSRRPPGSTTHTLMAAVPPA